MSVTRSYDSSTDDHALSRQVFTRQDVGMQGNTLVDTDEQESQARASLEMVRLPSYDAILV